MSKKVLTGRNPRMITILSKLAFVGLLRIDENLHALNLKGNFIKAC